MAYVRKVGEKHKCEVHITVDGRELKDSKYFDTKQAATEWGKERERELRSLRNGGFPRTTVRKLLERWRDEMAPTRGGARWDVSRLNAITARLGAAGLADLQLEQFGPRQMAEVREARLAEISPPSVSREEALLKAVWAKARHPSWSLTSVDPFRDLGPIKGSSGVARERKASWGELKRILRELGYHPRGPELTKKSQVGLSMMVALRTTLRSQEVLQLGDDSINLSRRIIKIEQHKTRYITNSAKRVPLLPKALVLFARKCLGKGRFFTVSSGSRDTLYREAKAMAGVDDLTFHDLKRTSVIMLKRLLSEADLLTVTGNKDVKTLRRHYTTETAADASDVVWAALGKVPGKVFSDAGVAVS